MPLGLGPDAVVTGSLPVALLVALVAGAVSFVSPCVLPLVPGFLGYIGGATANAPLRRSGVVLGSVLFTLGFTATFVVMIATFSQLTELVALNRSWLTRVLGLVVIGLGLVFMGLGPSAWSAKPRWRPAAGLLGAPALGVIFGLGFGPCATPTLAAVLTLAQSDGGGATRGATLAMAYGLGLGLPFIAVATGYAWAGRALARFRAHQRGLQIGGGILLVVFGLLMVTGLWEVWMARLGTYVITWQAGL
jgi:cytochrome c-type biogenesis protein